MKNIRKISINNEEIKEGIYEETNKEKNKGKNDEINVLFDGIFEPGQILKCKSDEKMKFVCLKFASNNDLDFNLLTFFNFLDELKDSDFNKPVNMFASFKNNIWIIVRESISKKELESLKIKIIKVIFLYKNQPIVIESFVHSKMLNISKIFADTIEKDFNSLNFIYQNKNLDFSKKLSEILEQIGKDVDRIEIVVQENKNKIKSDLNSQNNKQNPLTKHLINIDNNI